MIKIHLNNKCTLLTPLGPRISTGGWSKDQQHLIITSSSLKSGFAQISRTLQVYSLEHSVERAWHTETVSLFYLLLSFALCRLTMPPKETKLKSKGNIFNVSLGTNWVMSSTNKVTASAEQSIAPKSQSTVRP